MTARDVLEQTVLAAAQHLIEAFARHDRVAYFDAFSPEATFIFHATEAAVPSRDAYEALWEQWEREDGWRVRSCHSSDRAVQLLGDAAVFHHRVHTTVATKMGEVHLQERETIIFRRVAGDRWVAVHEHLSPMPAPAGASLP